MSELLAIGLSSWIIQDGNYADFKRGQTSAFALEFYAPEPLRPCERFAPEDRSLEWKHDSEYVVRGVVAFMSDSWWVLDAGLKLFGGNPPASMRVGQGLVGRINVGVDPFFYFETLSAIPGAPAIIYDWIIGDVLMQTAPWIPMAEGSRSLVRDPARLGWKSILATDAWRDDDGSASYLLKCTRQDGEPRHRR